MTINNLSGNFQPLTQVGGGSLPQSNSRNEVAPLPSKIQPDFQPQIEVEIRDAISSLQVKDDRPAENQILSRRYEEQSRISQSIQRRLSFQVDEASGKTVIRVFDRETDELIRQFPPDEILTLSRRLKELNDEVSGNSNLGILIKSEV
jgi:flagellar protein FlaG